MQELGFLAKKIISAFCYPLGFSLALLMAGLLLSAFSRTRAIARLAIVVGTLIILACSFPLVGHSVLNGLESQAGPYADPVELLSAGVSHIVVLGGSLVRAGMTPADRWQCSLLRVMEGVRLWRAIPDARLVLSGGSYPGLPSEAPAMAELPRQLGVPADALILETSALDTADEVRLFSRIVSDKPFGLVTSAFHMPRAVKLFTRAGCRPIPCPCDFRAGLEPPRFRWFLPSAEALKETETAFHEYLGMAWTALKP